MARKVAISGLWSLALLLFWSPLRAASDLALNDDRYVQILAAPLIFAFLMYWERKRIFAEVAWDAAIGIPLLALALSTYLIFLKRATYANASGRLCLAVLALIFGCMAVFILCYGRQSFRAAHFPLWCLLLAVPVPAWAMDKITVALQHGSAATSYEMLRLFGVPVFAQEMRLSLPGLEIEVAPECSGIRSFLALALLAIVVSRICLRNGWSRIALVISTIPIAILKNAVRISVIALLSAYVDRAFLHGPIHRYGGLVFTPLAVILFVAVLSGLRRSEIWMGRRLEMQHRLPEAVSAASVRAT